MKKSPTPVSRPPTAQNYTRQTASTFSVNASTQPQLQTGVRPGPPTTSPFERHEDTIIAFSKDMEQKIAELRTTYEKVTESYKRQVLEIKLWCEKVIDNECRLTEKLDVEHRAYMRQKEEEIQHIYMTFQREKENLRDKFEQRLRDTHQNHDAEVERLKRDFAIEREAFLSESKRSSTYMREQQLKDIASLKNDFAREKAEWGISIKQAKEEEAGSRSALNAIKSDIARHLESWKADLTGSEQDNPLKEAIKWKTKLEGIS